MKKIILASAIAMTMTTPVLAAQSIIGVSCGGGSASFTMQEEVSAVADVTNVTVNSTILTSSLTLEDSNYTITTSMNDSLCPPTSVSVTISGSTYTKSYQ